MVYRPPTLHALYGKVIGIKIEKDTSLDEKEEYHFIQVQVGITNHVNM